MPDEEPKPKRSLADIIAAVKGPDTPATPNADGPGRPTKFTPEIGGRIVLALANGATRKDAALIGGVDYKTFWRWMADGQEDDSQFRNFARQVETVEAELFTQLAQVVLTAAKSDPKMALEVLKRRRRFDWGDSLDISKLSTEQLLEIWNASDPAA